MSSHGSIGRHVAPIRKPGEGRGGEPSPHGGRYRLGFVGLGCRLRVDAKETPRLTARRLARPAGAGTARRLGLKVGVSQLLQLTPCARTQTRPAPNSAAQAASPPTEQGCSAAATVTARDPTGDQAGLAGTPARFAAGLFLLVGRVGQISCSGATQQNSRTGGWPCRDVPKAGVGAAGPPAQPQDPSGQQVARPPWGGGGQQWPLQKLCPLGQHAPRGPRAGGGRRPRPARSPASAAPGCPACDRCAPCRPGSIWPTRSRRVSCSARGGPSRRAVAGRRTPPAR